VNRKNSFLQKQPAGARKLARDYQGRVIEQRVVAALKPFGLAEPILKRGSRSGVAEF
jgi:hypothetical protein